MKKLLFCIIATIIATVSMAQDGAPRHRERREFNPEECAKRQTERLHSVLQLDSIQYQAVFLINYADAQTMQDSMKARRERAEKLRANGERPKRIKPSEEEMKARVELEKQRREVRDAQMKQILTPEQYEKYIKYCEDKAKKGERGGKGRHRRGGGRR